jgi:hypothetical protein
VGADEAGHVLDQPDHGNAHPGEHRQRLADVREGDLLGRRDEDGAADRHGLGEGQLRVRRARRQVDHEVVEVAPLDVAQELLDRAADERAAPHDRLALGDEELDRDDLDAVSLERGDLVAGRRLRLAVDAEHHRDVRAGDVRVEQSHRRARLRERDGEVDRDRRFSDAALARRDGDDVLDPGHQLLRLGRRRTADHRAPRDVDCLDAERRQLRANVGLDLVFERTGGRRQLDRERHVRARDAQVLDHVAGDQVAAQLGLLDLAERVEDGGLGYGGHHGKGALSRVRAFGRSLRRYPTARHRRAPSGTQVARRARHPPRPQGVRIARPSRARPCEIRTARRSTATKAGI